jgi:hypothetical protein
MYTGEGENTLIILTQLRGAKVGLKIIRGGGGGAGGGGGGGGGVTSRFSGLSGVRVILGIPFFRLSINYKCTPRVKELGNVEVHRFFFH